MAEWLNPQRELKRLEKQLTRMSEALSRCEPGWFIDCEWVDASTSRFVDLSRMPLSNRHIETRKFTRGKFVTVQEGKTWRDPHIVISMERTDELSEITVVPTLCVRQLEVAEAKVPLETFKDFPFNPNSPSQGQVQVQEQGKGKGRAGKRLIRFADGSVKDIGLTVKVEERG